MFRLRGYVAGYSSFLFIRSEGFVLVLSILFLRALAMHGRTLKLLAFNLNDVERKLIIYFGHCACLGPFPRDHDVSHMMFLAGIQNNIVGKHLISGA